MTVRKSQDVMREAIEKGEIVYHTDPLRPPDKTEVSKTPDLDKIAKPLQAQGAAKCKEGAQKAREAKEAKKDLPPDPPEAQKTQQGQGLNGEQDGEVPRREVLPRTLTTVHRRSY